MTSDTCQELVRERSPDRYIATLYAPPAARAALFALHALDLELAAVVRTTTEAMLGQIRLAWWREHLAGLDAGERPAQPVLQAIASDVLPRGVSGASLEFLEDANLALLEEEGIEPYALARGRLFGAAGRVLGATPEMLPELDRLGAGWAAVDALRDGHFTADADVAGQIEAWLAPVRLPTDARPIGALASPARRDLAAIRAFGWDASKLDRRQGTPGRQARLLWSIVTGR